MPASQVWGAIRERIEDEEEEEDLMDFVSEGDGESFDSLEDPISKNVKFETTVFVCNLPKTDKTKMEKLLSVLGKVMDKYGPNEKNMPFDEETGKSCGMAIVTYESKGASDTAVATLDGCAAHRARSKWLMA